MTKRKGSESWEVEGALELITKFWNRQPFHDMRIDEIVAINRRVVIRLDEFTLVVTGVTRFRKQIEEFPTAWLNQTIVPESGAFTLKVEAEFGDFEVVGRDLRLIRNRDCAVLIPPIDC